MKPFLVALLLLSLISICDAVSLQQVVKLSKLKTSDDVIIKLLQKEGLDKPVTSKDVVYLKEQGVSDRVIAYVMKISSEKPEKLPQQEGKSAYISENLRTYQTTTKSGKKVTVVTNLDEKGKRMGGELPPESAGSAIEPAYPEKEPREVYVIVKSEEPAPRDYEVEYAPPYPSNGIPLYDTYYPSYPVPYAPFFPFDSFKRHRPRNISPQLPGSSRFTTRGLRNLVQPRNTQPN
ncbi:MAG TPA: hypothetical protein VI958_00415, partial [Acidobacteriota bacterium]